VFAERQKRLAKIRGSAPMLLGAKEYYRTHPHEFIEHWCTTYDPRNAGSDRLTALPFVLFRRQRELVDLLLACMEGQTSGLVEKCRDMGATWVCVAFSVWLWVFWPGVAIGWGSRKQELVDRIGDPDSIFEKMRMLINGLPKEFLPPKFDMSFMRIVNHETGATITGEVGENIGRGGRKSIYFKDEAAHYERPEKIEAALGDNTRVQIDISSVNGLGNVFHRRREAGIEWAPGQPVVAANANVFIMDWRDHPAKDQAWYDARRAKAQADGLLHVFAQEVERNYAASLEGVIIPAEWVEAAIDAHVKLGIREDGPWAAALDVADGGHDRNALAKRRGPVLKSVEEWGERDTGVTSRRTIAAMADIGSIEIQYDCIGVGSGVKSEINRLSDEALMPKGIRFVAWNAGAEVLNPDDRVIPGDVESPLNRDFYTNLKAQAWWELRCRFERTFKAVTEGVQYNFDELISLPSYLPNLGTIRKELSQPTVSKGMRLKLMVDKTPEGTKSPNMGDAIVMLYWPMPTKGFTISDAFLKRIAMR
jgi:phage terminase large subunit